MYTNLFRDKWHCDFPWHPLKFLTNFQKYLMFALKQPVGPRHFRKNKFEKQSNSSHLSILSPDQSNGQKPLTYWRPSWDTRQLRSRLRERKMHFHSLHSPPFLFFGCLSNHPMPKQRNSSQKQGKPQLTAIPRWRQIVGKHRVWLHC